MSPKGGPSPPLPPTVATCSSRAHRLVVGLAENLHHLIECVRRLTNPFIRYAENKAC